VALPGPVPVPSSGTSKARFAAALLGSLSAQLGHWKLLSLMTCMVHATSVRFGLLGGRLLPLSPRGGSSRARVEDLSESGPFLVPLRYTLHRHRSAQLRAAVTRTTAHADTSGVWDRFCDSADPALRHEGAARAFPVLELWARLLSGTFESLLDVISHVLVRWGWAIGAGTVGLHVHARQPSPRFISCCLI
jgi:hypothetical protein